MTDGEQDDLIRRYASGNITWQALRAGGVDNYLDVLGALGRLGLRPPVAPLDGPNAEARIRGRALLREALVAAVR